MYFALLFHSNIDDYSGKSRVSSFIGNVEFFFSMMMKLSMFCANIARAVEMDEFHNISDPFESIFNINFKD